MNSTQKETYLQKKTEESMFLPLILTGIFYLLFFMCLFYICIKCGCMKKCFCTCKDPVEDSAEIAVCVQPPVVIHETQRV